MARKIVIFESINTMVLEMEDNMKFKQKEIQVWLYYYTYGCINLFFKDFVKRNPEFSLVEIQD